MVLLPEREHDRIPSTGVLPDMSAPATGFESATHAHHKFGVELQNSRATDGNLKLSGPHQREQAGDEDGRKARC